MPKVPGITKDLLQKQILELLEEIGIPAKEWIGKGGDKLKRLVTKGEFSALKPNLLSALSRENKTYGDALNVFRNEAKFMMGANDQELMNLKNNLNDYTNLGGAPKGPSDEGLGSMMKNLETEAKNLKTTTEEMKDLALKNIKDLEDSLKYGGDPFKVPNKTSVGGTMHVEGNIRTALREFMQSELKAGKLKLNKKDTLRVTEYSPMSEDDPIDVFRRHYGEDALESVVDIAHVFEKGESYKHYEQLLRQNVDEKILKPKTQGAGEYDANVQAAEDIRTKVEKGEIETIAPEVSETDVMKMKMKKNIKNLPAFKKTGLTDADMDFILRDLEIGMEGDEAYATVLKNAEIIDSIKQGAGKNVTSPWRPGPKVFKDKKGETTGIAMGYTDDELKMLDEAMKKGMAESDAMKEAGLDPSKQADFFKWEAMKKSKLDRYPMRLIKNFETDLTQEGLMQEGYSAEESDILLRARGVMKEGEMNPNEALTRVKEQMADETGVDLDELTFDFQIDEPEPFASGGGVRSLFPPENGIGSMFRGV